MDTYAHNAGVRDPAVKLDILLAHSFGHATVRRVDVVQQKKVSGHSTESPNIAANRSIGMLSVDQDKVEACATLLDKAIPRRGASGVSICQDKSPPAGSIVFLHLQEALILRVVRHQGNRRVRWSPALLVAQDRESQGPQPLEGADLKKGDYLCCPYSRYAAEEDVKAYMEFRRYLRSVEILNPTAHDFLVQLMYALNHAVAH